MRSNCKTLQFMLYLVRGELLSGWILHIHRTVILITGLESHPYHELTKRQTSGHSGMMSMYIDGGRKEAENFLTAIKLFIMAESLGGYESLAEIP